MSKKKAVAYARYSTDMQREESIDAQIRAIEKYAKDNDIEVINHYIDEGYSGRTLDRPQFQLMLRDSDKEIFDYVIVHKLDRFSRDRYNSAIAKNKLKSNNVKLLSVLENLDGSPESVILEALTEGMAEYFSKNLSREVRKGHNENAYKALHNGGLPPFGYDVNEEKEYVINESEAIAVRYMFESYIDSTTYRDMIKWLNKNNFKTKHGNEFTPTAILTITKNEKYYGLYTYGIRKKTIQDGRRVMKEQSNKDKIIKIENGMPAIISKETFDLAAQRRESNKEKGSSDTSKVNYLLSSILYCDLCGSVMHGGRRDKYRPPVYRCSNANRGKGCKQKDVDKALVEESIIEHLSREVFTKDFTDRIIEFVHEKTDNYNLINNTYSHLEKNLLKVNKQIENLSNAILNGLYSETMNEKFIILENEKEKLEEEIIKEKLKEEIILDDNKIREFLSQGENLSKLEHKQQKILLQTLVSKVTYSDIESEYPIVVFLRLTPALRFGSNNSSGRAYIEELPDIEIKIPLVKAN